MNSKKQKEEERRRKAAALVPVVQNAVKQGAAYKNPMTVSTTKAVPVVKSAKSTAAAKPAAQQSTTQSRGLKMLPVIGKGTQNTQTTAARPVVTPVKQHRTDQRDLQMNMLAWHQTSDPAKRAALHTANDAIRARHGYTYRNGVTRDRQGRNLSAPVTMLTGGRRAAAAKDRELFIQSREADGKGANDVALKPTMEQLRAGMGDAAAGVNAHSVMYDLYRRAGDTWTDEDVRNRDAARQALADEMQRILARYGLTYTGRRYGDTGGTVNDAAALERLRQAGASEDVLRYVEENIGYRRAADRFGRGAEAAGKGLGGGIAYFGESAKQEFDNWNANERNPAYKAAEQEYQRIQTQMGLLPKQNADGTMNEEYAALEKQAQAAQAKMLLEADTTRVSRDSTGSQLLRESAEAAQAATAGLAPVPRWLTEQGISLAQNAPSMAASAIPVVGPAVGAAIMGASAAGQRANELNARSDVTPSDAFRRGLISGGIEAATEKLPLDAMADILNKGGTGFVKSILKQMGVEAGEESASYLLNFIADKAADDPQAEFSFAELARQAAGGAFSGLVFGAAGALGAGAADEGRTSAAGAYDYQQNQMQEIVQMDGELRAAMNLPDGPAKEYAVQTARERLTNRLSDLNAQQYAELSENAARNGAFDDLSDTPNGFAGKKIPTYDELIEKPDVRVVDIRETPVGSYKEQRKNFMSSEEAQQLYRQPVTNYDTGEMVFVTPKTLEHSFSNGGQLQISAAKQIKQIIEQSVLTNAEPITHGDTNTTGIYTLFGAVRTNDGVQPVKLKVKEYQLGNQQIPQNIAEYFNTYGVPEQYASAYDNKVLTLESIEKEDASSSVQPTLAADQAAQGEHPSASSFMETSGSIPPTLAADRAAQGEYPLASSYITVADLMGLVNGEARRFLPKNAENSNSSGENIPLGEYMQYGKTPEQAAAVQEQIRQTVRAYSEGTANGQSIAKRTMAAQQRGNQISVTAWPEGTPKPNLQAEREERPQSTYRTPEEELRLQSELASHFAEEQTPDTGGLYDLPPRSMREFQQRRREQAARDFGIPQERIEAEERIAPADDVDSGFARGDMVRTADRGNIGEVLNDNGDGTYNVRFRNSETGAEAVHRAAADNLQRIAEEGSYRTATEAERAAAAEEALTPSLDDSAMREGEQPPDANFPLGELMQYGKTPEQAARELRETLRNQRKFSMDEAAAETRRAEARGLRGAWEQTRPLRDRIEHVREDAGLSEHDERLLQSMMLSGRTEAIQDAENPTTVLYLYQLMAQERELSQPIREYQAQRQEQMQLQAEEYADMIAENATDKKIPAAYARETQERNSYDIFGPEHRAEAERLNREYFTPVHKASADRTNYVNTMRERVKALDLDTHESALVQLMLENENAAAGEYIRNNHIRVTPQLQAKVANAVSEFRAIYNDLYDRMSETLLANGQEPPRFRRNYAPHFVKDKPDTMLGRIRFALGLGKDSSLTLPTDIAGITDEFRPGKKWFGHLLQREGEITDYDAVGGFDRYIETAADVIYMTDSVQKLRALEDAVRYRLSDEGTRAKIDEIRRDNTADALQKRQKMEEVYGDDGGTVQQLMQTLQRQKRMGMAGYVSNLREYTNILAGKKSKSDRGWEEMIGRQMYTVARNLEGRVAANMIAANPGSWLTNFIPITQAAGEVSVPNLVRAMRDTVRAYAHDDGFADGSVFLTNRRGTDALDKTLVRRIGDAAGRPMEWIDQFTANTVVRGKYLDNVKNGMSDAEAYENADAFAANLMADRSKGSMPTAFNATNPVSKVFTMFQLEVNNQLSYLLKDLPQAKREAGKAALAWSYAKVFTGAYVFNALYSQLTGRDSALDPIGMIADALGIGDDDDDKERTGWDVAESLGKSAVENLPFVGGVLGGGRVPISSALPSPETIWNALSGSAAPGKKAQTVGKELMKPAIYLLPPFGGGAVNRLVNGFQTVRAGGSYSLDSDGNPVLQFPAYGQTPLDYAKSMIFGKWSSKEAQRYIDSGFDGLNAKETAAYDTLHGMGVSSRDAWAAVRGLEGFETVKDEDGKTIQTRKEQQRLALLDNDTLTAAQKAALDRALLVSGEDEQPADYSDRTAFLLSQYIGDSRKSAARAALSTGLTIDQFAQWDARLSAVKGEKTADDKSKFTTAEAAGRVLSEIQNDSSLRDSEKQALADTVLISALGDSAAEKWKDAKGKVNATDFVRFRADMSEYREEYAGTDADGAENAAKLLRGYTGLTDEQRDVLFQTQYDSLKNNPFHESEYEKKLADNSFYKDLNDAGRAKVRSLCNEYEQAMDEDKELDGWKAKAYMAKEAGIAPETYALMQTALAAINTDGGGAKNAELTAAVKCIPGLTDHQRAYLWQAAKGGSSTKNNPWGAVSVTKYESGRAEAVNPVEGGTLSSSFGPRSAPKAGASTWHKAVDIAADAGTPVRATLPGKIVAVNKSGWGGGYGVSVRVEHADGVVTEYHHMQEGSVDGLNVGDEVEAGQQIGKVGSTGNSTGPHLDLQAWKDGKIVDPLMVIPGYGEASGYVYDGTVSSGVIAGGQAAAAASGSGGSSGSGSGGLKKLKGLKGLPVFR